MNSLNVIKRGKLITCILPKGNAVEIAHALKEKKNVNDFNIHHSRGSGTSMPVGKKGVGQQMEKDVLLVNVPDKIADEIFEFLYEEAKIGRPHGGFMYMSKLQFFTPVVLPDIPEEV